MVRAGGLTVPLLAPSVRNGGKFSAWAAASMALLAIAAVAVAVSSTGRVLLVEVVSADSCADAANPSHCKMEAACGAHRGDQEACFAVEPLCEGCGERKPCYYAFGKCLLRNGYGPKYDEEDEEGRMKAAAPGGAEPPLKLLGDAAGGPDDDKVAGGNPVLSIFGKDEVTDGGLVTVDPTGGAHETETPGKVKKLANITEGDGPHLEDGPKLQFCQWGSEMVPCAPGYGGAWYEHHTEDAGIWPNLPEAPHAHLRYHVKAGRRSHPYLDDFFKYGSAGIFGAKRIGPPTVAAGRMLAGGHENAQRKQRAEAGAGAERGHVSVGSLLSAMRASGIMAEEGGGERSAAASTRRQQEQLAAATGERRVAQGGQGGQGGVAQGVREPCECTTAECHECAPHNIEDSARAERTQAVQERRARDAEEEEERREQGGRVGEHLPALGVRQFYWS